METDTGENVVSRASNLERIRAYREQIQEGMRLAAIERGESRRRKNSSKKAEAALTPEAKERYRKTRLEKDRKAHAENPAIRMLRTAQIRASKLGLPFNLTVEDIKVPDSCPILGIPLRVSRGFGPSQNSPSLDRIIPELGYVRGNVQVVSHKANAMKNDATPEDMLAFAHWCTTNFGLYGVRTSTSHGSR